jgi:Flp pilus assembly protein TadD
MSAQALRAQDLLRAKRPDEAIKVLLQGLTSTPDDPELHCMLAQAHIVLRRPHEALKAASDAVRFAPDMEWAHRLRSIALRQLNKKRESTEAAMQAVRLAPELAASHEILAEAYLDAGHANEAYAAAYEARRLEPDSSGVHDLLGRCFLAQKQYAQAEAAFRHALRLDASNSVAHNNLGVALHRQGRRVEAVGAYTTAAKIDPDSETARKNVYSGTGRLLGGGFVVIAVISIFRLSVLVNSLRHPSPATVLIGALFVGTIAFFLLRRGLPVRAKDLPAAAVAYYRAENRRLRLEERPIQFLRVGSILFAVVMTALGLAVIQSGGILLSAGILLLTIVVTALWYTYSPAIWRRIRSRRDTA